MIRLLDKTKISWFSFFYVFCMIIYAGMATVFARELGDIRTVGNAFALVVTLFFYIQNKILFDKKYLLSISVFLFYAAITSIKNHMINLFWISQWVIWLTIAYGMCKGLGKRFFVTVETVLYYLSIIALVIWIIHVINPSFVESLVRALEFSRPYGEGETNVVANMIFYTINNDLGPDASSQFFFFKRNAGFAWEPGAFACFICLGIYCNILRKGLSLKDNRVLWGFLLALFSTQSTTGFMTLILMMGVWMLANRKYGWAVIIIPLALFVFSLPFVSDKMLAEFQSLASLDYTNVRGQLNRTYSLIVDYQEFLQHPIIGLGGWIGGTYLSKMGYEVTTISGIGDMLVRFGAIMTLIFVYLLIKACNRIKNVFGSSDAYIFIAVILAMMYSYALWSQPIFISFWMYGVYSVEIQRKKVLRGKNTTK